MITAFAIIFTIRHKSYLQCKRNWKKDNADRWQRGWRGNWGGEIGFSKLCIKIPVSGISIKQIKLVIALCVQMLFRRVDNDNAHICMCKSCYKYAHTYIYIYIYMHIYVDRYMHNHKAYTLTCINNFYRTHLLIK